MRLFLEIHKTQDHLKILTFYFKMRRAVAEKNKLYSS